MIGVVPDRDVFAKDFLAHAASEAGALVEHGCARKIVKQKTDQIEHGGRLENHGVVSRRESRAACANRRTFRWRFRPARPDRITRMSGEFALAQPEEFSSRMVIENSARVCRGERKPLGIGHHGLHRAAGKNSGGGLFGLVGHACRRARRRGRDPAAWHAAVAAKWRATF